MSWGEKVMSRVLTPGFILVVVGMAMVFGSAFLAKTVPEQRRQVANLIIKGAGAVVTLVGAVLVFAL